jgi:hypothetical protein
MVTIILLSLAGVVISVGVGSFWYSMATPMGRLHMKYLGFDRLTPAEQQSKIAEAKPHMPKIYTGQMVLSLLSSFATVFIIVMSVQNGLNFMMATMFVFFNWLFYIVPTVGGTILWGNCDSAIAWKKFFSDILCILVTLVLVSLMTGLFV